MVAVTHDRYFLDNAAEWILELDRGHGIPWKGNYSTWLEQKEDRLEQERRPASPPARRPSRKNSNGFARTPRAARPRAKARMARFEELSSYEYQKRNETQEIFIPVGERLGSEVIEFEGVSKAYGDRLLIDNLSFKVPAGAIVGIIGPNGAGKSTLFRMIAGREQPDSGCGRDRPDRQAGLRRPVARRAGKTTRPCSTPSPTAPDMLTVGKFEMASRAYLGRFNFKGSDQQQDRRRSCRAASAAACTWPRR